jgi:signal transduction histidine kinase
MEPRWFTALPLRWRLTSWYLATLSLILLLFAGFLFWRLQISLRQQLDIAIQLAATEAAALLGPAGAQPTPEITATLLANEQFTGYRFMLADATGRLTPFPSSAPFPLANNTLTTGFTTQLAGDDEWRVLAQPLAEGWLLVAADLDQINDTLDRLLTLMLLALPPLLLLAGGGGYFLAARALAPIDRITETAATINGTDLTRRIGPTGSVDEVGTPIAVIKGHLEIALQKPRPPEEYVTTMSLLLKTANQLTDLANQLMYLRRYDPERSITLDREKIAAAEFLGAIVEQVEPLAQQKGQQLVEKVPADLQIQGSLDQLIRLFLILLDNAIKYTPAGGTITVSACQRGSQVQIAVTDDGPGIAAEHLPHLFERFYRVDSARGRQDGGGSGLGLAIAQEIVTAHDGEIKVASELGRGTVFTVSLPLDSGVVA